MISYPKRGSKGLGAREEEEEFRGIGQREENTWNWCHFYPWGGVPGLWGKIGEKLSGCGNFISWLGVEACNVDEEMGAPLTWGS